MKAFIEEYGKIVATVIVLAVIVSFIGIFLANLSISPEKTVGTDTATDKLVEFSERGKPLLTVTPAKLEAGTSYDLLSFVTKATTSGGDDLKDNVTVTKIMDPFGNELTVPEKTDGKIMFTFDSYEMDVNKTEPDDYTVGYRVTYEVIDNHFADYPVSTSKTYQFVVN